MAPLLPKLRGRFAEFLNKGSPVRLRIFFSSTCVGLRYGHLKIFSNFSRQREFEDFVSFVHSPSQPSLMTCVLHYKPASLLGRALPVARFFYPSVSLLHLLSRWYRNINLLSITYAFRPPLRSRLTPGGRTFPGKPQTFDGGVSRSALATYAGILSSIQSTTPFGMASARIHCSSTNAHSCIPKLRCQV